MEPNDIHEAAVVDDSFSAAASGASASASGAATSGAASTAPGSAGAASADASHGEPGFWHLWRQRMVDYYPRHRHAVTYGVTGALAAILMLIIGFWPVLLIGVLTFLGVAFGQYRDDDPRIILFFIKLFRKNS